MTKILIEIDTDTQRVVPVEPTVKILCAGRDTPCETTGDDAVDAPEDYRRVYRAMIAAASQPEPVDVWQPIETAPEDEFVLLAGPSWYETIETVFTTGRMCSDYRAGRWIDHADEDLTDWGFNPTHWIPLPKPPTMSQGEQK